MRLKSWAIAGLLSSALISLAAPATAREEGEDQRMDRYGRSQEAPRTRADVYPQREQPAPRPEPATMPAPAAPRTSDAPRGRDWNAEPRAHQSEAVRQPQPVQRPAMPDQRATPQTPRAMPDRPIWSDNRRRDNDARPDQRDGTEERQDNHGWGQRVPSRNRDDLNRRDRGWSDNDRGWNDRRAERNDRHWDDRSDNRDWRDRQDHGRDDRWRDGRDDRRRWDNGWRHDRRYDWESWRRDHRSHYRLPYYRVPYGWSYGYFRISIGRYLDTMLFSSSYWIDDPFRYRLPPVYGPYRWVRYYDDALLVDIRDGYVVDVVYDIFW